MPNDHPRIADIDLLLMVNRARWTGARERGDAGETATYAGLIDQLLDRRLTSMGVGVCGCGAAKDLFGSTVAFCPRCDFRTCQGCGHQILSLTAVKCPSCGAVADS